MGKAFRPFGNRSGVTSSDVEPPRIIPPWAALLGKTIESEILPRLLSVHRDEQGFDYQGELRWRRNPDLQEFLALIVADDMEQARAVADRVVVQSGGRDGLLNELLRPAALMLGEMWDRDDCDFTTVTLGVFRLDQIMKETSGAGEPVLMSGHEHRILLLPAPGEQHGFGVSMVADAFREGGWCVRSGPAVSRARLLRLVRGEWFDVVGLSVTAERALKGLPACIRAVRAASCNPGVHIMLGGRAVSEHAERSRFLGADATAKDALEALAGANIYMESTVTEGLHQSKTRLVDIG